MARRLLPCVLLGVIICICFVGGCARSGTGPPDPGPIDELASPTLITSQLSIDEHALLEPEQFGEPGWRQAPHTTSPTQPSYGTSPGPGSDASAIFGWGNDETDGWALAMPHCAGYDDNDYPAQRHRIDLRYRAFTHPSRNARQWVERFEPGWAARSLADAQKAVAACTHYEYSLPGPDSPGFLESQTIEDSGFAGDESLLVETSRLNIPGTSQTWYTAMVRRGDLVTTLSLIGTDADTVRRLASLAAAQLR